MKYMDIKLSYSVAALHATAKYIWENNPRVRYWPSKPSDSFDVLCDIRESMVKYARKNALVIHTSILTGKPVADGEWNPYIGTGGYFLLFSCRDDYPLDGSVVDSPIVIDVTITVSPAIGDPDSMYIDELVDNFMDCRVK